MTSILVIKNKVFRLAIQVQLSKKLKLFYQFFIAFLKSTPNFAHVEKKIKFTVQLYPILLTPKDILT